MNVSDYLNKAADIIEEKGWIQGDFETEDGVCVNRAITLVTWSDRGRPMDIELSDQVRRALREYLSSAPLSLYKWNDKPGRTKEEVLAALRGAAEATR